MPDPAQEILNAMRSYATAAGTERLKKLVPKVGVLPRGTREFKITVAGTVDGKGARGTIEPVDGGRGLALGPAWRRDCGVDPGDEVAVVLHPEGPQRDDLAPDLAAALEAEPEAGAFFDSLAQYYRRAYLRWVDGTKRRPEVRAARIAELVELLRAGHEERPR